MALFGAYFPFWLICLAVGVVGAAVVRLAFIQLGIDEVLPVRLLVYVALGVLIAFTLAMTAYGR